jgi:hypothetical protein
MGGKDKLTPFAENEPKKILKSEFAYSGIRPNNRPFMTPLAPDCTSAAREKDKV